MKNHINNKVTTIFRILLVTALFSFGNQVFGQEKLSVSAGLGIPELLNVGVRYEFDQVQLGVSIGTIPWDDGEQFSISANFRRRFAGYSELSKRRPWYGRLGLHYARFESEYEINKYLYLNTSFGREFSITEKFGIELDIGAFYQLSRKNEIIKDRSGLRLDIEFPVLPSIGLGVFYRI